MSQSSLSSRWRLFRDLLRFESSSRAVVLNVALFLVLLANFAFWQGFVDALGAITVKHMTFMAVFAVLLTAVINLLLIPFSFKYVLKPVVILILLTSAIASYFMQNYGVMIDVTMMQNVMETDPAEAGELLSLKMLWHLLVFGGVPSLIVYHTRIVYKPWPRELLAKGVSMLASLAVIMVVGMVYYKDIASFSRNHNQLRNLINPLNYVTALERYMQKKLVPPPQMVSIGKDAYRLSNWQTRGKKNLTILVVGETARADNFSLGGYTRETNPQLARQDVVYFSQATSCGTATAISVPCMFSNLGHDNYDDRTARYRENMLDVLKHSGVEVVWRDNDSGCKGVCSRVAYEDVSHEKHPQLCKDGECFDEILLENLQQRIDNLTEDAVIVLHQKGSHGPTYYQRYPESFHRFTPSCDTNQLEECEQEQVVNVYDNTILYTDHVLSQVIDLLRKNSDKLNTAMIYMSDHGESLGENNVYLHGLPYMIAPDTQKHVPLVVWLSDGMTASAGIDKTCLKTHAQDVVSHDNLFHSVLGIMDVDSEVYDSRLDIFAACTHNLHARMAAHHNHETSANKS
jgi:lipid A ethanolaminephosphotransferase